MEDGPDQCNWLLVECEERFLSGKNPLIREGSAEQKRDLEGLEDSVGNGRGMQDRVRPA